MQDNNQNGISGKVIVAAMALACAVAVTGLIVTYDVIKLGVNTFKEYYPPKGVVVESVSEQP